MTFTIYEGQQSSIQFWMKWITALLLSFQATLAATLRPPSAAHRTARGTCFAVYAQESNENSGDVLDLIDTQLTLQVKESSRRNHSGKPQAFLQYTISTQPILKYSLHWAKCTKTCSRLSNTTADPTQLGPVLPTQSMLDMKIAIILFILFKYH